jgi:MFS family permease
MEKSFLERSFAEKSSSPVPMWLAAWLVTAVFMLSNSATPLYTFWQDEMAFSTGTLTVIFAVYIAGLLATLVVAGQLSDRYGRRPVLLPGLAVALTSSVLFAVAESVWTLALARLLAGIAVGVIVSAGMASVGDLGGADRRRQAALLASVAMVLGAGLGPLLAGALAQVLTRPVVPVFAVEFVVLLSAFLVAAMLPLHRPVHRPGRSHHAAPRLHFPSVPARNRAHLASGIAAFGPGITATSFVLALGPSLLSRLSGVHSPLVAGGMACAMFLFATGVQFAVSRWRMHAIFRVSTASTVMAMLLLVIAVRGASAAALVMAALFAGAGQGLGQLAGLTLINTHVPDTHRAEANSLLNIGGYVPAGVLPVAAGYLIDYLGLPAGVTVFAALLAGTALGGGWLIHRLLPKAA